MSNNGKKKSMTFVLFLFKNIPELPDTTEPSRTDLSRDLAALHEICVAHSDELRTLSNERGAMQVRADTRHRLVPKYVEN